MKYPGTYTVRRGEKFAGFDQRIGGITPYANPNGAVFAREALRKQEAERISLLRDELKQEIATMTLHDVNPVSLTTPVRLQGNDGGQSAGKQQGCRSHDYRHAGDLVWRQAG